MKNTKFQGSGDVGRGLPGNSQASETLDGHLSLSCTSQMRKLKKKDQGPAQFHLSEANRERAWGTWESGHSMKESVIKQD